MSDQKKQELMMRVVDQVATDIEIDELNHLIEDNPALRDEFIAMKRIKEVTDSMKFTEMPDSYWGGYWSGIYNRLERGLGWVLFSIGGVILLLFGLYAIFKGFFLNGDVSIILRLAVFVGGSGAAILLWSIVREVFFARSKERYKEVER